MGTTQGYSDHKEPLETSFESMESPVKQPIASFSSSPVHSFSVEKAAHALRTRLALASAKVSNGWAAHKLEDLEESVSHVINSQPSPSSSSFHDKSLRTDVDLVLSGGASFWSPPMHLDKPFSVEDQQDAAMDLQRPILVEKRGVMPNDIHPQDQAASIHETSSSRSVQPITPPRGNRIKMVSASHEKANEPSIYAALFGSNFSSIPSNGSGTLGRPFSPNDPRLERRDRPAPNSPALSVNGRSHALLSSPQAFKGVASILNCAAASPQLGSPDRINGPPYDPHNDPTLEQQALELHSVFAPPQSPVHRSQDAGSHSKRRRTAAADAAAGLHEGSPARARSWAGVAGSSPAAKQRYSNASSLLSNGHRASSLAQNLGLARTPGTPSRGGTSTRRSDSRARGRVANDVDMQDHEQDDTDRAAELLAAMAEDRSVASSSRTPGRGFNEKTSPRLSYGDPSRTSPWSDRQAAASLTSPSVRALGSSTRSTSRPQTPDSSLRGSLAGSTKTSAREDPRTPTMAGRRKTTSNRGGADESTIGRDDDEAARLMLFLASSPSNSQESVKSRSSLRKIPSQLREVNMNSDAQMTSKGDGIEVSNDALAQEEEQRSTHSQQSTGSAASDDSAISSLLLQSQPLLINGDNTQTSSTTASQDPLNLDSQLDNGSVVLTSATDRVKTPPRTSQTSSESTPPPRTPPLPPSTPRTPNAPGSSFSYGDFLNVSPSPQPRNSVRLGPSGGAGGYTPRAMAKHAMQTPSRAAGNGTENKGRFLDFAEMVDANERGGGGAPPPSSAAALSRVTGTPAGASRSGAPISSVALQNLGMDIDAPPSVGSSSSPGLSSLGNVHLTPSRKRARVVSVEDALGARLD